ncbi:hypothetical protein GN958_ATG03307, partial [Phytophthora infestans]
VGELATTEAYVVAVNAEGKPCVWVLDSEKVANLMMWLLVNKLLEDVALASVDNESSNLPVHVSLVASAIWRKSYFCKKVNILGNTLLSNISIRQRGSKHSSPSTNIFTS